MQRLYGLLADLTVAVHFGFVAFVIVAQILILIGWARRWRWARSMPFRVVHLASIGVVVLQAWLGVICPLTIFENWLREKAGGAIYEMTFIGHWSSRLLFYEAPSWVFTLCYTLFGAMVLACFIGYPPRRKNRLAAPDAPPQDVGVR